ncbi:LOW QUALITY PROTEIN: hypothetical protein ACHAXT_011557 [Thalassiosira profunda]
MADAPPPPPGGPAPGAAAAAAASGGGGGGGVPANLPHFPSNAQIVNVEHQALALLLLRTVERLQAHIPNASGHLPMRGVGDLLWNGVDAELDGQYSRWATTRVSRNLKDRTMALLDHYSNWNQATTPYPTQLQVLALRLHDEWYGVVQEQTQRRNTARQLEESRQEANDASEGALGLLPRARGSEVPSLPRADAVSRSQAQEAASLLAQNPRMTRTTPLKFSRPPPSFLGRPELPLEEIPPAAVRTSRQRAVHRRVVHRRVVHRRVVRAEVLLLDVVPVPLLRVVSLLGVGDVVGAGDVAVVVVLQLRERLRSSSGRNGGAGNARAMSRAEAQRVQRLQGEYLADGAVDEDAEVRHIDEADAARMRRPRNVDGVDVLDSMNRGINRSIQALTDAVAGSRGGGAASNRGGGSLAGRVRSRSDERSERIHDLCKRMKLAKELDRPQAVLDQYEREIAALEEEDFRENRSNNRGGNPGGS